MDLSVPGKKKATLAWYAALAEEEGATARTPSWCCYAAVAVRPIASAYFR
jgi:hypothetical protein